MAVDIKHLADYSDKLRNVSNIVTETVGTTTSYTFPEDTLHPYIKRNLKEYIVKHWEDEEIQDMVNALRKQAKTEVAEGWVGAVSIPEGDDVDVKEVKEAVAEYALNQIDSSDLAVLKSRIVKDGYSKGQLQGHLFPDVLPAFKKWIAEGKKIFMYSSGLEMSQKCLVSNSVEGDITELISGCFYSSEFPRTRSESFREMCKKVDCSAEKVAFLTDNAQTARAAHKAGLVVIMLCREGNSYVGNSIRESFPVINSFDDISQHICGKRKMSGEDSEDTCGKKPKLDESMTDTERKEDKPSTPISITVTPPEEETGERKEKDEAAEETMEVDDKRENEKEVSEVKEGTTEEVGKEEVESMEIDGKVPEDKKAEEEKSEEKVEVEIKDPEVFAEEGAEDKDEKKVAEHGAEEKPEEKAEEPKGEVETEVENKGNDAVESKEAEKEEKVNEAAESKSEETKPEGKSEEDEGKKSEEVEEKIEEKKSEEEVSKSEEVEESEKILAVKSVDGQGEDEKPAEGADVVKNNVDEKSADEVVKENGEAEKEVCSNGIEETKENGVSSDEKVEAIKAVPKKAELEGSANEAAAQESA